MPLLLGMRFTCCSPLFFTELSVIGKGAFGTVRLIRARKLYALKSIKKSMILSEDLLENLLREQEILGKLSHPFIVRVNRWFQTTSHVHLMMEYLPGGDLLTWVTTTEMAPETTRFYLAEITSALCYLHSKKIVYRDLKLENVVLDAKGHARLVDFGLSQKMGKMKRTRTFCGTDYYMAPEIVLEEFYSFEVDWWALGIVAYGMNQCKFPFSSDDNGELYEMIKEKQVTFHPDTKIERPLKHLIIGLLQKVPEDRLGGSSIKKHRYFYGVDFQRLHKMHAPIQPRVENGIGVSGNSEEGECTVEIIEEKPLLPEKNVLFKRFKRIYR